MDAFIQRIWSELEPHIEEQGFELIEVQVGKSGRRSTLRIFIDKVGGVTLDDCAEVSQVLSAVLDTTDLFTESYVLEVSSPGFDRPLRKAKDFERFIGETVRLRVITPIQGQKNFRGELVGFHDGFIVLNCDGVCHEIHIENLDRANLVR